MESGEIKNRLKMVFCTNFKLDEKDFNEMGATIDNIEEWDSLSHVSLMLQIEKKFECKIPQEQVLIMDSFNKIQDYLISICR